MSGMSELEFNQPQLPAVGLVDSLSTEDRRMLSSYGSFSFLLDGSLVIQQGKPQEFLYFLISGSLHAKSVETGHETLLGTIRSGEWFGEINIFDPSTALATVVAVDQCQIWRISRVELQQFFEHYPAPAFQLTVSIATGLSRRLRGVTAQLIKKTDYDYLLADLT